MPTLHLPVISNAPTITPQGESVKAREVFDRMASHPDQRRKGMVWSDLLAAVARDRCEAQAHEGWTGHVDPLGFGPNAWVRAAGWELPDSYGKGDADNWIESLLHGGQGNVESVWATWMGSPGHRDHILGIGEYSDIYAAQVCVGVGWYRLETSKYKNYFCILTCPPEE